MNKEQIKGGTKEVAGKVQKEFGKAVDSPRNVIQGGMKQAAGKTEKTVGGIRQVMKDARKGADRDAGKRSV
jgi:uncharacterized protein YjbJ (UPF0337 family)